MNFQHSLLGYYRQAIGPLRVSLETLAMAATFTATSDIESFEACQAGILEAKFSRARVLLRDSAEGRRVDVDTSRRQFSGDADDPWLNARFKCVCDCAHNRAGHDNGGFWESNGLYSYRARCHSRAGVPRNARTLPLPTTHPGRDSPPAGRPQDGWSQYVPSCEPGCCSFSIIAGSILGIGSICSLSDRYAPRQRAVRSLSLRLSLACPTCSECPPSRATPRRA